jgi:hypothetical protein
MRHIRMITAAAAVGAVVCATAAMPSAQAQTAATSQAKGLVTSKATTSPVVGVNLYVNENYTLAQIKEWGARDLAYIAYTLKLKAVQIDWDYNVPTADSNIVKASATRTPTIADLEALTTLAKFYGLSVSYRALFAINNRDSRSGSIDPKHLSVWLNWLLATENATLRLAQRDKVSEFVVGTEMASIDQSPLWAGFFKKAAKIYHGILSYAQWGGSPGEGGFFSASRTSFPLTHLGVSAYPPLALSSLASVGSLTKAWENFLTRYTPASVLRRTAIDEIGIPAVRGAYSDPWQWNGLTGPADPTIQARWFAAACNAATAEHMRGIYFWSMALNDDPGNPYPSLVGFLVRPASLAAIRSCA